MIDKFKLIYVADDSQLDDVGPHSVFDFTDPPEEVLRINAPWSKLLTQAEADQILTIVNRLIERHRAQAAENGD